MLDRNLGLRVHPRTDPECAPASIHEVPRRVICGNPPCPARARWERAGQSPARYFDATPLDTARSGRGKATACTKPCKGRNSIANNEGLLENSAPGVTLANPREGRPGHERVRKYQ